MGKRVLIIFEVPLMKIGDTADGACLCKAQAQLARPTQLHGYTLVRT